MAKYEVTAVETVKYLIEIEANSADEAERIAVDRWHKSENPTVDFDGQGYGIEVTHVSLNGRLQPEY